MLIDVMQEILSSVYAVTASTYLHKPLPSPISVQGSVSSVSNRLYIINPVAFTTLCILAVIASVPVGVLIQSLSHESILYEEPVSLLGAMVLLSNNSDVQRTADFLRQREHNGRCIERYKKGFRNDEYRNALWMETEWNNPCEMRITKN